MTKRAPYFSAGFSLIEIMVSTTIIALMLGGGIAAFIQFRDRQTVLGDVHEVQQYLYTAQTKARVGDTPAGCDRLSAYQVSRSATATELVMEAVCESGEVEVSRLTLRSTVTFPGSSPILFLGLRGGATGVGTITVVGSELTYEFEVSGTGTMSKGEFVD